MPSLADRYGLDSFPWEKLESETMKQFQAFVVYRELGPTRTLREAAIIHYRIPEGQYDPKMGKMRVFERWSARNKWVQRCEEYDQYVELKESEKNADTVRRMKVRHQSIAAAATAKVVEGINALDATKLNGVQLMQMFDLAVKNERLALGVPNDITALTNVEGGPVEMASVTDEALEGKLRAWLASRDPKNEIEKGEPDGGDDLPDGAP